MDLFVNLPYGLNPLAVLSTILYSVIGALVMAAVLWIIVKLSPFSVRKEIEEDQNTALAIIIAAVFLSLAIIIHGAMR
jgi:putative membrane protein